MTDKPGTSGAQAGFPTPAQTGDEPGHDQQHLPRGGFSETIFNQPPGQESLSFTRPTWWRFWPTCLPSDSRRPRLRNNLHLAIGLLEFANIGDVAANVWNTVPIPSYIKAFMWIGGLIALSMLFFVWVDAKRSWENIQGLQSERKRVKRMQMRRLRCPGRPRDSCQCFLEVNKKELRCERDRLVMVVLLGSAALLVGIGTCIAPFGENREIFEASNYLTGPAGNSPSAIYGLLNVWFTGFVCLRAFRHRRNAQEKLENDTIKSLVRDRTDKILFHGLLNGIAVMGAGAAAMCTATYQFAYIGLGVASVASFFFNWFWRQELGYDRQFYHEEVEFEERHLLRAISHTHCLLEQVSRGEVPFGLTMEYIVRHDIFDEFCRDILGKRKLRGRIVGPAPYPVTIDRERLVARVRATEAGDNFREGIESAARQSLVKLLKHRERWFLEILGCHITICGFSRTPVCKVDEDTDLEDCCSSNVPTARATPEASPHLARSIETHKLKSELG